MNSQPPELIEEIIIAPEAMELQHEPEEVEINIAPEDLLYDSVEELELQDPKLPDDAIGVTKCENCNRYFDSKQGIECHLAFCKGPDPNARPLYLNNCEFCLASFKYPSGLEAHMNVHKGIKPYKCRMQCDMHFYSVPLRIAHEKKCYGDQQICQFCNSRLSNPLMLARHLKSAHKGAKYECKVCGKMLASNKTLQVHQRMLHSSDAPKYICEVCGKDFTDVRSMERHMGDHNQCPVRLASGVPLKSHTRVTRGKIMLPCEICASEFPNSTALHIHRQMTHKEVLTANRKNAEVDEVSSTDSL